MWRMATGLDTAEFFFFISQPSKKLTEIYVIILAGFCSILFFGLSIQYKNVIENPNPLFKMD
jgi:hypothetical protein